MLNVKNQDPDDLALQANVSASDEIKGFEANQVIDGINRDIQDGKSHQWRARVTSGQEPWIQLAWNSPITVGQIEFTFDTGLNRFEVDSLKRYPILKSRDYEMEKWFIPTL